MERPVTVWIRHVSELQHAHGTEGNRQQIIIISIEDKLDR